MAYQPHLGWVLFHNSKDTPTKPHSLRLHANRHIIALLKSLQKECIQDKHRTKNCWEKQVALTAHISRIQKLKHLCCIFYPLWNPNFQHTVNLQFNKGLLVHSKKKPATNFGMKEKVFKLLWQSPAQDSN